MSRIRKSVHDLTDAEVKLLAKAYQGIMALDETEDKRSYFYLAGLHGIPSEWCMHHIQSFAPWHRLYMLEFENALRSIEGCENVTLPYADPMHPKGMFADWCDQFPFGSYTVPESKYKYFQDYIKQNQQTWNGGKTFRNNNKQIAEAILANQVPRLLDLANNAKTWSEFANDAKVHVDHGLEDAHDQIHNSVGGDLGWMADVDIAAFDPIFWFHHSNIERLFCEWQLKNNATTKEGLERIRGDYTIPWNTTDKDLNFTSKGFPEFLVWLPEISYASEYSAEEAISVPAPVRHIHSFKAKKTNQVQLLQSYSIMIKSIDRSKIKGSFYAYVDVNDIRVIKICIFQKGLGCDTCAEKKFLSYIRELPIGLTLPCKLNVYFRDAHGNPLDVGTPTFNIRAAINDEPNF